MQERRGLCREAERRARAGEMPGAIRAALGVSRGTYARWAMRLGFRQADLYPDRAGAGARVVHPPGPGNYARSGRFYDGLGMPGDHPVQITGEGHPGWTGGIAASRGRDAGRRDGVRDAAAAQVEALSAVELLDKIKTAMAAGKLARVDRWLSALRAQGRRKAQLEELEAAAAAERVEAGELPEGWQPGEHISGPVINTMDQYLLYLHFCVLAKRKKMSREDWEAREAEWARAKAEAPLS